MTENSDMERQVYNGIMRMNEALYLESVMTADSRLESILWVLYAAYKGIPLRSKSDSDLDFLSNEEKYIYVILRSHIENHLQQSHVLHILEDAFYHFTRIDQDYFKSAYPDALSFVFQYSYERSGRMAAFFAQPPRIKTTLIADTSPLTHPPTDEWDTTVKRNSRTEEMYGAHFEE